MGRHRLDTSMLLRMMKAEAAGESIKRESEVDDAATPVDERSIVTTINPWHSSRIDGSQREFQYRGNRLFTHRGVVVYKSVYGGYDYIIDGMTITQRAGFTTSRTPEIINALLDGTDIIPCSPVVGAHLIKLGFTPNVREIE